MDDDAAYRALLTHDARFDGRLFVGVTSTGIYCRPVCRVRAPRQSNCRFYPNAPQAEQAGFRPCLRCRPELAPGWSTVDASQVLARQAAQHLDQSLSEGRPMSLAQLAARLGITDRHLRRIFVDAHGVSPQAYLNTHRLLLAKRLLTDTRLPITQIALQAGFGSLRRFNDAFATHYRLTPTAVRLSGSLGRKSAQAEAGGDMDTAEAKSARPQQTGEREQAAETRPSAVVSKGKKASSSESPPSPGADGEPPTHARLGKSPTTPIAHGGTTADALSLSLAYRPPYDQAAMLAFLTRRAVPGLECVNGSTLRRSLSVVSPDGDTTSGWLEVTFPQAASTRHGVGLRLSPTLSAALGPVLSAVRQGLDLDADPALMAPSLVDLPGPVRAGLRLPGAFDGFEAAVRVILGQQITVAGARTITQRLVQAFGTPIETPWPEVSRCFPSARTLAVADPAEIGQLGIVRQRVRALQGLAQAVVNGLPLHRNAPLDDTLARLLALPGIGPWSAQLIAMRCLAWPDAFPASDIGVLNALGHRDAARAEEQSQAWRPWRAYAVMHLWMNLE